MLKHSEAQSLREKPVAFYAVRQSQQHVLPDASGLAEKLQASVVLKVSSSKCPYFAITECHCSVITEHAVRR